VEYDLMPSSKVVQVQKRTITMIWATSQTTSQPWC